MREGHPHALRPIKLGESTAHWPWQHALIKTYCQRPLCRSL